MLRGNKREPDLVTRKNPFMTYSAYLSYLSYGIFSLLVISCYDICRFGIGTIRNMINNIIAELEECCEDPLKW